MPGLEIQSVSKSFAEGNRRREVLCDLSLTVAGGGTVALVGRSGSGKSTLLNIVAGIEQPSAGAVRVDGVEVSALSERERTLYRRHRIGFVFQFFNLLPTLTVAENVLLPLELVGRAAGAGDRVRELLEAVGLGDRGAAFPDRLSGGEQQRVAVARALAHEPALLLADEPTGALDAETGRDVLALLMELARGQRTVLLVTHSAEVARAADRVLVLENGRLGER